LKDWLEQAIGVPGKLRFILQPLVAIILGIRAGLADARAGREPLIFSLIMRRGRGRHLAAVIGEIALPLSIGILADAVFQWISLRHVTPIWAIQVGILLIALPYFVSRALANRISGRSRRGHRGGVPGGAAGHPTA
jgi:hypothetical protein